MAFESERHIEERLTRVEQRLQAIHDTVISLHEQFNHLFVALLTAGLTALYLATR